MTANCCVAGNDVMLMACSGASNVGQLTNQAAIELTQEGAGKMFCLAGVGAHLSGFVQSAKDVPVMIAIDGCNIGCAGIILEHLNIKPTSHLVLTNEGIEKNKNFTLERADIDRVKEMVRKVAGGASGSGEPASNSCCGCST